MQVAVSLYLCSPLSLRTSILFHCYFFDRAIPIPFSIFHFQSKSSPTSFRSASRFYSGATISFVLIRLRPPGTCMISRTYHFPASFQILRFLQLLWSRCCWKWDFELNSDSPFSCFNWVFVASDDWLMIVVVIRVNDPGAFFLFNKFRSMVVRFSSVLLVGNFWILFHRLEFIYAFHNARYGSWLVNFCLVQCIYSCLSWLEPTFGYILPNMCTQSIWLVSFEEIMGNLA